MSFWQQVSVHMTEHTCQYLLVALALGAFSAAAAVALLVRVRLLTRPLSRIRDAAGDPAETLPAVLRSVEEAELRITRLDEKLDAHIEESQWFTKHVGLVRYNAFDDVAGMQSFSMCLLNAKKDGVLVTYLTGKNFTRSYAVTIENGKPSRELSEDETRAMDEALSREVVSQS